MLLTSHDDNKEQKEKLLNLALILKKSHCLIPSDVLEFNISDLELTDFDDEEFYLLENVTYINASENYLTLDAFTKLKNLKELQISVNGLRGLNLTSQDYSNLQKLNASYNNLSEQDISEISKLRNLKYLDISGNNLSYLVDDTSNGFTSLIEMVAEQNQFSDEKIFCVLAALPCLEKLNLSNNEFQHIPENSQFNRNEYCKIPIKNKKKTRKLDICTDNLNSNIEIDLFFPKLKVLDLSSNKLLNVKDYQAIKYWTSMENILIYDNPVAINKCNNILSESGKNIQIIKKKPDPPTKKLQTPILPKPLHVCKSQSIASKLKLSRRNSLCRADTNNQLSLKESYFEDDLKNMEMLNSINNQYSLTGINSNDKNFDNIYECSENKTAVRSINRSDNLKNKSDNHKLNDGNLLEQINTFSLSYLNEENNNLDINNYNKTNRSNSCREKIVKEDSNNWNLVRSSSSRETNINFSSNNFILPNIENNGGNILPPIANKTNFLRNKKIGFETELSKNDKQPNNFDEFEYYDEDDSDNDQLYDEYDNKSNEESEMVSPNNLIIGKLNKDEDSTQQLILVDNVKSSFTNCQLYEKHKNPFIFDEENDYSILNDINESYLDFRNLPNKKDVGANMRALKHMLDHPLNMPY